MMRDGVKEKIIEFLKDYIIEIILIPFLLTWMIAISLLAIIVALYVYMSTKSILLAFIAFDLTMPISYRLLWGALDWMADLLAEFGDKLEKWLK